MSYLAGLKEPIVLSRWPKAGCIKGYKRNVAWNGNAAANNGSLFVVQDNRIRRLSPLECERLMGFKDNYTGLTGAKRTQRYAAVGNAWAVPVIRWIGKRIENGFSDESILSESQMKIDIGQEEYSFYNLGKDICSAPFEMYSRRQPRGAESGMAKLTRKMQVSFSTD